MIYPDAVKKMFQLVSVTVLEECGMLNIYPEFSSSGIAYAARSQQAITPARREGLPDLMREGSVEHAGFIWSLPLRYSGLPVRRRLIRMMLSLQKCGGAGGRLEYRGRDAFTAAADYARSVIDTAMLRGELRCRPSGEMARAYLAQTEELLILMVSVQQDKALLRKEVRRRTADFLRQYAAGAEV